MSAAPIRTNHEPPCGYMRFIMTVIGLLASACIFGMGVTLSKVNRVEQTAVKNATYVSESKTRFEYISKSLDEIKAEIRQIP